MKPAITYRLIVLLLLSLFAGNANGQNMVPNGDFEYYTTCPTATTQITRCVGWQKYHVGTPDYFNLCGTSSVGVPSNMYGYHYAASGNGYVGFATYNYPDTIYVDSCYKEFIARDIIPMTIGKLYEVSVSVSLASLSAYSTNDLGVWFYDVGIPILSVLQMHLPVTPQVSYTSYGAVTNTTGWVRLSETFVADSTYDNIVIGGFGNHTTTYANTTGISGWNTAYYYVDSVVVKEATGVGINYTDSILCIGDTIHVPYTVYVGGTPFNSGNKFILQLSNTSGSFSTPIVLDSVTSTTSGAITAVIPTSIIPGAGYRIRVISTSPGYVSKDNRKNIAIATHPASVSASALATILCSRDSLQLYGSSTTSNVSYMWSGPSSYTSTAQNPIIYNAATSASGKYLLTVSNYGCKTKDSVTITVNPSPNVITASYNSPLCEPDTIKLFSTNSSSGVTWGWTGPSSYTASLQNPIRPASSSSMAGKYYVTATASNGCKAKDSVDVTVKPLPANFSATTNAPVCQNSTVNLYGNTTSSGVTFSWSGPSFSS
ncbi:MAG: hypothetical protein JST82_12975, partial [Bacteroidetes bacterium]|nr:hypothetical protein [Bacteroidota bacterium]